jgi:hypothetical protein
MTGWKMVFCDGPVAVGAVAADAPPATTNEIPAPRTGKLVFMRFRLEGCFACAMVEHSFGRKYSWSSERTLILFPWRYVIVSIVGCFD